MFRDASVLARRSAHHQLSDALKSYTKNAHAWFDGTPDSVDRRIDACKRVAAVARSTAGAEKIGDASRHLRISSRMESDLAALRSLRHDLLTGCSNRAEPAHPAPRRDARVELLAKEQRWVALESAKFARDNADALDDREELAVRAAEFVRDATGTLAHARSAAITEAFCEQVARHGRRAARVARKNAARNATPDVVEDFDPALLYLM